MASHRPDDAKPWEVAVGIVILILLAALLVQFAWNVGLVGTLAAAGIAQIAGISYWTALGTLALLGVVRASFLKIYVSK
jgi:hypothetical protein